MPPIIRIPDPSLVVLIGVTGSGKSTFAARHFLPTEVLSSDRARAMVADDENDQGATREAFEVVQLVARLRLGLGRLTVIDATNVLPESRTPLLVLAGEHRVPAVAIVLDVPEDVLRERRVARPDRRLGPQVIRQHRHVLRRSLDRLDGEGFRPVFVLHSVEEIDAAGVIRERAPAEPSDL